MSFISALAGGGGVQVDSYTTPGSHTWNKPMGAVAVEVICIGGGTVAGNAVATGGTGGNGGNGAVYVITYFSA